jgi:phosphatidate cytidylyltransferase
METYLYILVLIDFLLGAIAILSINKKRTPQQIKDNWLKFSTYFIIVLLMFLCISFNFFTFLSVIIILAGYFELIRLTISSKRIKTGILGLAVFTLVFFSFYFFSLLKQPYLFFTVFIVTVFDAFSQLAGHYFGKRKLIPSISPNKTVEGLAGGFIMSGITALFIRQLLALDVRESLLWALGIVIFSLAGDLFASYLKRRFGVKDYSHLIPGHGGFLDRFDSLVFSSLFVQLMINTHL